MLEDQGEQQDCNALMYEIDHVSKQVQSWLLTLKDARKERRVPFEDIDKRTR